MTEHRALPQGQHGWMFNGQYFESKGACVAYMVEHVGLSLTTIAKAFPGGTKANCSSAYKWYKQKRAVQIHHGR